MSRLRLVLILLIIPVATAFWWVYRKNTMPPAVSFVKVRRETLVSTLGTNGKVEPSTWVAIRTERPGIIEKDNVQKGQQVAKGMLMVELDARDARAQLAAAEARVAQARAELATVTQGGKSSAQVEIENEITRAKMDLQNAQRNYDSLRRLAAKQAATEQEVQEARQRVQQYQAEIEALEKKRSALVAPADRATAEANLREAQSSLDQARALVERSHIHAPIPGIVYELSAREGAYVNLGDELAKIGNLHTLRVRIYVDEPELGRVSAGMPVLITWDALPGRSWKGTVEKMPTQVVALGTRQVGEVLCTIDNPDLELLPGTNVNVEIQSQVVESGLTIPKEAIQRNSSNQVGVFVLRDDHVEWQPITLGPSSVTRVSVSQGLKEGDRVALPTEQPLRTGQRVRVAGEV